MIVVVGIARLQTVRGDFSQLRALFVSAGAFGIKLVNEFFLYERAILHACLNFQLAADKFLKPAEQTDRKVCEEKPHGQFHLFQDECLLCALLPTA